MGILNRTPDSFYDRGAYWELDVLFKRAEQLVAEGADILDVGGVKAGPGPRRRRGRGARTGRAGRRGPARPVRCAPVGGHLAGIGGRRLLPGGGGAWATTSAASPTRSTSPWRPARRASVVATHIRLAPRVADPEPHYDDVVGAVAVFLADRAARARAAGIPAARIVVDAGLDLGKTWQQSLVLLRASDRLAGSGLPAAAFRIQQDVPRQAARPGGGRAAGRLAWLPPPSASPSDAGLSGPTTCRGTRRVCDLLAAVMAAP